MALHRYKQDTSLNKVHCFPTDNPYACDRDTNGSYWSYQQQQDPGSHQNTVVHPQQQQQQQHYSSQWSHNGGYNQEALGMTSCWMQQQQHQQYQPHHQQRQTLPNAMNNNSSSCMNYTNQQQQQYSHQQMMYTNQQQQQIQPLQMQQPGGYYRNNVVATVTLQSAVTSTGPCSSRTPSRCDSVRSEACESSCSTLSGGGGSGGLMIDQTSPDMMSCHEKSPNTFGVQYQQQQQHCNPGLYTQATQSCYNNYQPHQNQLQLQQQQQQQYNQQQQQMLYAQQQQQQYNQQQMMYASHYDAQGEPLVEQRQQQYYRSQQQQQQQQQTNCQQITGGYWTGNSIISQQQQEQQHLLLEEQEEEETLEGQFDCSLGPMLTTDGDTSIDDDEALAACSSTSSVTSPQSQLNPSPIGTCLADTTASPSTTTGYAEVAAPTTPPAEPIQPEDIEPEQLSLSPPELHIQSELLVELPSTTTSTSSSPVPVATATEIVYVPPPPPPPSEPTSPELAAPVNVPDGWTRDVSAGSVIYIR